MQAIFINFGELASICWTSVIAWTLFKSVVKQRLDIIETYELKMHLFAYGVPFLFTIGPATIDYYGEAGGWCWIK